jgi:hypothetical protein
MDTDERRPAPLLGRSSGIGPGTSARAAEQEQEGTPRPRRSGACLVAGHRHTPEARRILAKPPPPAKAASPPLPPPRRVDFATSATHAESGIEGPAGPGPRAILPTPRATPIYRPAPARDVRIVSEVGPRRPKKDDPASSGDRGVIDANENPSATPGGRSPGVRACRTNSVRSTGRSRNRGGRRWSSDRGRSIPRRARGSVPGPWASRRPRSGSAAPAPCRRRA